MIAFNDRDADNNDGSNDADNLMTIVLTLLAMFLWQ